MSSTNEHEPVMPAASTELSKGLLKKWPFFWKTVFLIFAYLVFAEIGKSMSIQDLSDLVYLIWPAAGLSLAIVMRGGYKYLIAVLLGIGIWLTWFNQMPPLYTCGLMLAYGLSAFFSGWVLRHLLSKEYALEGISDVFIFLLVGPFIGGLISSSLGTATLCWSNEEVPWIAYTRLFTAWWLGDAMGMLVVSPFLLVWTSRTKVNWHNRQTVEVFLWLFVLIFFGMIIFEKWAPTDTLRYPLELTIFPIMAWASIRFGQRGATTGVLILSIMALWQLIQVLGPENKEISQSPVFMWVFVGVIGSTSYFLSAILTEVRRREERHAQNEERLRAFIDALPDIAYVISSKGEYLEVFAPDVSAIYEDAEKMKGTYLKDNWPEALSIRFQETVTNTLLKGEAQKLEYCVLRDSEEYWFEGRIAPMVNEEAEWDRVIWLAYEITERKRAEAALQHRDKLLQGVAKANTQLLTLGNKIEAIQEAIESIGHSAGVNRVFIFENFYTHSESNVRFSLHYQWAQDGVEPFRVEQLEDMLWEEKFPGWYHDLSSHIIIRGAQDSFAPKIALELEQLKIETILLVPIWVQNDFWGVVGLDSGKSDRSWENSEVAALNVAAGSLGAFIEGKQAEDALKKAKETADAANAAKSEFLAMMSHEIRTPMNAILGFTDLLSRTHLEESQKETLNIIGKSGENLLELINNILDFSKIESRGVELEYLPFKLETTVFEALELMLVKAKEKNIKVDYELKGIKGPAYFVGDAHRLRQIILNLVNNAIKFTNKGSVRVIVTVSELASNAVEKGMYNILIEIIDTGIGISKEKIPRLFKPFSQADSSTTRQYGGTGLGLVICRRLIEKMGGDIQIESEEGKGSRFFFEIPFKGAESTEEEEKSKSDDTLSTGFAQQYPMQVLLVEDDQVNQKLFTTLLINLGYTVDVAEDDEGVSDRFQQAEYDLILMDVQLPGKSGLQITSDMRKGVYGEHYKRAYVIALTAFALPEDRQRCLDAGTNEYLAKPVSAVRLKEALVSGFNYLKK